MKIIRIIVFLVFICGKAQENQGVTHSEMKTGQSPFSTEIFTERPNPVPTDLKKWQKITQNAVGWGSTDIRFKKEEPALYLADNQLLTAWRGERVSAQIVISNTENDADFSVDFSDFKNEEKTISKEQISVGILRFVLTDELNKDKKGTCGHRKSTDFDSTLVADRIDPYKEIKILKNTTRAFWVSVAVPENASAAVYKTEFLIKNNGKIIKKLPLEINVLNRILPSPEKWSFHLDLWQNPYAVARFHNVTPWSSVHYDFLRKEMLPYVKAGGKSITASIMHKPWDGQTYDPFDSMVAWIKKADGSWHFDFSVFDKWVEFMHEMGVTKQINCYSMVPWKLSFQYFDEATNSLQTIETKPSEPPYETMWGAMLSAFSSHLKEKGWFEKTYISMDERPKDVMQSVLKIIKNADPNFKISLAGALHDELEPFLDDYCVALRMKFSQEIKNKRKAQGKVTTYYTSCEEPFPNTFTFSQPAESEWLAWYAAAENLDGYLRWAFNSWPKDPMHDSRFTAWGAGDTYLIYPNGRSSVRFERLVEGIQFYEKIKILQSEFSAQNNTKKLKKITKILKNFKDTKKLQVSVNQVVRKSKQKINTLSQ